MHLVHLGFSSSVSSLVSIIVLGSWDLVSLFYVVQSCGVLAAFYHTLFIIFVHYYLYVKCMYIYCIENNLYKKKFIGRNDIITTAKHIFASLLSNGN